jgi:hypothetical protein
MAEPTPEQKVARLFERLESATQPEDRRAAVTALVEVASEQAILVRGADAFVSLLGMLKPDSERGEQAEDSSDEELKREVLDVLVNLVDAKVPSSDPDAARSKASHNLDALLEDPSAVETVLGCLEEGDMYIRYNAIQLLLLVLGAERGRVQGYVLGNPIGIAAAAGLLNDGREVVRNEALLLLTELTRGCMEVGRFVAFQPGAFERLLEIVDEDLEEGGSVITDDALALVATLVRGNPSAQRLFIETGLVDKLHSLLQLTAAAAAEGGGGRLQPQRATSTQVRARCGASAGANGRWRRMISNVCLLVTRVHYPWLW